MIGLFDATQLAVTKLRTRKVRLFITIFISGLLFSVLAMVSQVGRGTFDSVNDFSKEGLGSRFILGAIPAVNNSGDVYMNPDIIARAQAINKDIVSRKTIEAKRLGLEYDPKSERSPVDEFDTPSGKQRSLMFDHPAAQQAIQEHNAKNMPAGKPELVQLGKKYDATNTFESRTMIIGGSGSPTLKVLKDGKESYEQSAKQSHGPPSGIDTFTQGWTLLSRDLMQPFLLPDSTMALGKDGSIPLIAPYSAVEQLLGLKAMPASAKPADKLQRIKVLRNDSNKISLQVCYRNQSSADLLNEAITQQQEIERNKTTKDYVKPSLIYALPATDKPCSLPTVSSDKRTADEKKLAIKQEEFDRIFGKKAPEQQIMTFRVVGIAPDASSANASGVASLIGMLLASSLGQSNGWYSPLESSQSNSLLASLFSSTGTTSGAYTQNYIELPDAKNAKAMLENENCQPDFGNITQSDSTANPFKDCLAAGKFFSFYPFGSNSLGLEEVTKGFAKYFGYAALAVASIAALIMIGTVGRIIADSRRETAVFRAIGAKKLDIVQVYILYALFLSLMIFAFALVAGFLMAQYVNSRYSAELTIQALVAYNAQDLTKTFNLYAFYLADILKLLGLSLAGGLLSAFLPLLRNLRRNPIRDMRDDT